MIKYKSLKQEFKPAYTLFTAEEIQDRVNSEDWYTICKGYPLTETRDIIDPLCPRMERIIR